MFPMARPTLLDREHLDGWLHTHAGWAREGDGAIARRFDFPDFSTALGFAVRIGLAAEKHDHHPDVTIGWGYARVVWSTHDAGGVTALDLQLADICNRAAG
jgi:4a-hydroxytetrahydrobiopterin dehydratase